MLSFTNMKAVTFFLLISLANGQTTTGESKEKYDENVGPPPPNAEPVYLSPFLSDGLFDPATGLKAPVDFLALRMVHPRNETERRQLLKTKPLSRIQFIEERTMPPPIYYNPRDKILEDLKNDTEKWDHLWFNFESQQNMNLNKLPTVKEPKMRYQALRPNLPRTLNDRFDNMFKDGTFMVYEKENRTYNWTTCDEFKKKSNFHPKDLVHVEWCPFYTWTNRPHDAAVIHKFTLAPLKMIARMKKDLGSRLPFGVDWQQHKLVMDDGDKHLLIAVDRLGLFYDIKDQPLPDYFIRNKALRYPIRVIRFKLVDKYLAMMVCNDFYATIMASPENLPQTDVEKERTAKVLKFKGEGFPVSRNLENERLTAEVRKQMLQKQEENKYIKVRNEGLSAERDQHFDKWSLK